MMEQNPDFINFHPDSKVWIYQSSRALTNAETEEIIVLGNAFVAEWAAHGSKLKAGFQVKYNRFLILIADETQALASGCSIDKSVGLIRQIEKMFSINLLDRMQVAYKVDESLVTAHLSDFESNLKNGTLTKDTIVFNNLVQSLRELNLKWEVPLMHSWHQQLL
jgi:hypothetical protein